MAKILLAEDDDDMRRFLRGILQKAGHEVQAYGQGNEALARLEVERFDLLLTDIVMPVMDGIELARRAAERFPELKIIFITGFAAVALNRRNGAPKEARVLSKAVHLRQIVEEVERMIAA
ncbi:MAG: response regulator [Alphaproteobacteria bacterium]|nr:response regulator [Alphaproteobacteria bacterium]